LLRKFYLQIVQTFVFSPTLKKVDLPTEEPPEGTVGDLSGWGTITYPSETYPDQLQHVDLTVQDRITCILYIPFSLHYGQLCALNSHGVGACFVSNLQNIETMR
jgi:hypothetical protein